MPKNMIFVLHFVPSFPCKMLTENWICILEREVCGFESQASQIGHNLLCYASLLVEKLKLRYAKFKKEQ